MFSKPKTFTLTFFFYLTLALTLAAVCDASSLSDLNRRDHIELKRLIKRRSPLPQSGQNLGGLIGVAPDPDPVSSNPNLQASSTSSAASLSTTTTVSQESSSATLTTASSTPLVASSASITSSSLTSGSSSSSISSSAISNATSSVPLTTTSASPSTTSAPQTSQSINLVGVSHSLAASTPDNTHTITRTATGQAESATASLSAAAASATASTKKTTFTVLIVIASSIGGVAVIWTIIRKWKFRPSSQFEDRMQPIDWQPTSSPDDGISPTHRRLSNASSFHSGSGHNDNTAGRGGYGATSNGLVPLPDHDFTPGVSILAPVGGYADLARGPSPQPQMQQALGRGPSASRPNFGVPIHHQAGYGVQDPYGGVY